jgi:hypothetical protein
LKNVVFWDVSPGSFVRTDVSDERSTSIIRVTRIDYVGTTLAVTSKVLERVTRGNIPEDGILHVIFEVFTAVAMKNCVFWDVTRCGSCKNRRFGGT